MEINGCYNVGTVLTKKLKLDLKGSFKILLVLSILDFSFIQP